MAHAPRHSGASRQLSWSGVGWVVLATPALVMATLAAALVAVPLAVVALLAPRLLRQRRAMPVSRSDASFEQMISNTAHLRQH